MSGVRIGLVAGALLALALPARAQQAEAPPAAQRAQQIQARFQIAAMEGVLERAVLLGAQNMRVQVQAAAPELLFITGAARARGFWLDGYGVFFDVDVPAMRRSLMWSFQMLNSGSRSVDGAIRRLRREAESVENPAVAARLQQAIVQLEREMGPLPAAAHGGAAGRPGGRQGAGPSPDSASQSATTARTAEDGRDGELTPAQAAILQNPGLAYTSEVKNALLEAMIEYSAPLPLAADHWLTVAARDQEGSRLQPGDPYEVSTLLLRIRGADLAGYRAGQIDASEVRRRVEIKEY